MTERSAWPVIGVISVVVIAVVAALARSGPAAAGPPTSVLPTVNALLNAISAVCLVVGFGFIRRRRIAAHRAAMVAAFAASTLFLVSYVAYHAQAGSRAFTGHGWVRAVYFPLLVSHIVLAAAILPLALATLWRAWRGDFARHARLARWTLPVWLYVSITGVLVYWMLYHL